jgi:hypothetical protein
MYGVTQRCLELHRCKARTLSRFSVYCVTAARSSQRAARRPRPYVAAARLQRANALARGEMVQPEVVQTHTRLADRGAALATAGAVHAPHEGQQHGRCAHAREARLEARREGDVPAHERAEELHVRLGQAAADEEAAGFGLREPRLNKAQASEHVARGHVVGRLRARKAAAINALTEQGGAELARSKNGIVKLCREKVDGREARAARIEERAAQVAQDMARVVAHGAPCLRVDEKRQRELGHGHARGQNAPLIHLAHRFHAKDGLALGHLGQRRVGRAWLRARAKDPAAVLVCDVVRPSCAPRRGTHDDRHLSLEALERESRKNAARPPTGEAHVKHVAAAAFSGEVSRAQPAHKRRGRVRRLPLRLKRAHTAGTCEHRRGCCEAD